MGHQNDPPLMCYERTDSRSILEYLEVPDAIVDNLPRYAS
jgi:hypothetical protein